MKMFEKNEQLIHDFLCPKCLDWFFEPVWHCPGCDHHWLVGDDECRNCYRYKRRRDGSIREIRGRRIDPLSR